jgi:hypothetical protein
LFRGGIARAGIAKPSIWHRNVDELIEEVEMKPEMKKTYHIDFRGSHTSACKGPNQFKCPDYGLEFQSHFRL